MNQVEDHSIAVGLYSVPDFVQNDTEFSLYLSNDTREFRVILEWHRETYCTKHCREEI